MKKTFRNPLIALLAVLLCAQAITSLRAADPLDADPLAALNAPQAPAKAELIAERSRIEPGKPITLGIRLKLQKGWHVYWKNPGGPGFPIAVEWQLPAGFKVGELQWPHPTRFDLAGLVNFGFEHEVLLTAELQTPAALKPGETVQIKGKVSWLACKEECLPGDAEVTLALEVAGPTRSPESTPEVRAAFAASRTAQPQVLSQWQASAAPTTTGYTLKVTGADAAKHAGGDVYFYSSEGDVVQSEPKQKVAIQGDTLTIELPRAKPPEGKETPPPAPTRLTGALVSHKAWDAEGKHKALAIDVALDASGAPPAPVSHGTPANAAIPAEVDGLPLTLVFAFVGGLILNLMPCVFPVLAIKILGFVQQAGEHKAVVRNHGFLFGLGVLTSFWALAGLLIALRAGGGSLGWGFQMQEPAFVLGMILLMFAIALNLAGVFEIGVSLTAVAGNVGVGAGGYRKSFLSGVLATLIATPCTAPFMGAALAAALSMPAWQAMLVFTALGAGMATPYVVLSCVPALLKYLPRPGAWMESFKQFMAFPMFATVAWLAWVYLTITDPLQLLKLLIGLTVFAMGAWWYGRWGNMLRKPVARWVARAGALACVVAAVLIAHYTEPPAPGEGTVTWEPFSKERVAELRAQGRPVLVDFTASWCVTCQWNKGVVLRTQAADALYQKHNVAVLVADWSKRDAKTLKVLQQYGREGVPLYLMFPADPTSPPEVLPNILTPGIVEDAVKKAAAADGPSQAAAK